MDGNHGGDVLDKKKSHRNRNSGRKAEKKKSKKDAQNPVLQESSDGHRNPKAFAFNSAIRAERRFRRKQDIETKKQHIPLVDRTPLEPPPILIAVVGPPKVGKSTLIKNLIKLFTKSPLTDIKGPVTIVTGKKRRITIIECNNDINSMIDLAKIADLVLLLCDASFGFEMEIFEFLNICQVHGMPRIMGILTHLDMIKNSKALKTTKKMLKHRFWTEVYSGAKLFYLSGIVHGEYLRNEIKNLGRFISVMKFRPLQWRTTHSYLLGDRYEDLTNQELIRRNPNCDRNISLYGYVRGVPIKKDTYVHIAGMGDIKIDDISYLPDPCSLPEHIKKRALIEKEKLIYAPFSGVGGIVYDKDAVYVELGGSHSHTKRNDDGETSNIVTNLIETKETLDMKLEHSELQLFTGGKTITAQDLDDSDESATDPPETYIKRPEVKQSDLEEELDVLKEERAKVGEEKIEMSGRIRRKVVFPVSDEDFSKTLTDDDSDSESSEEQEDLVKEKGTSSNLSIAGRKSNKYQELNAKISGLLKNLENREQKMEDDDSSEAEGDSDLEMSMDDTKEAVAKISNIKEKLSAEVDSSSEDGSDAESDDSSSEEYNDSLSKLEVEHEESSDSSENEISVKWKENLTKKAEEAFFERQRSTQNLMKLVYGKYEGRQRKETSKREQNELEAEDDIGGLFKVVSHDQQKLKMERDSMNLQESSLFMPWKETTKDWLDSNNKVLIQNCFVTGKWKDSEDASELLKLDEAEVSDDGSEVFGDFEDLETGEKHEAVPESSKKRKHEGNEKEATKEALAEKKRKLKEKFDAEYDNNEKTSYYDDLKTNAEKQFQLNKSVFENMDDDLRVQIEGFRPGMYVRIEFKDVAAEFVTNFDPTYPLLIGALNMGEENVGYVNVRLKKHRWYKKILKTNDPLIVSLGWRRFQTIPLFSKLEDDMKFRYLKYTPQHLSCNAHFWGPITPQGSGLLALQSCQSNPEILKQQGFRIAATGVVQELDKSTQIMKKLKLVGYPLKIYKKTAFIKGMFNSTLEVAKFEGARIRTVSGIRGQIKKAVSKPEGCFRATFEDKIQLSDIVFCRTWYKVDVPKFYNPVTTLMLPHDKKNSWKGVRTTGELKRDKGIRNLSEENSLYKPIVREPKVFKPLVIPRKLQEALPYRDKPKYGVKASERKKSMDRIAVIKEPHEQKVSSMIKKIKASYQHKQNQLKAATKERMEKHKQMVEALENKRTKKIQAKKKEVFRAKSKAAIRQETKGFKK